MNLVLLALFSCLSFSKQVIFTKGEVKVIRNQKIILAKKGTALKVGDKVQTGKKSLAILNLLNQSKIKLSENSAITVSELKINKKKKNVTKILMGAGEAFINVVKSKNQDFTVKAKTVAMGVRGTEFFASIAKNSDNKSDDLWMCVNSGEVVVSNNGSKGVPVKAGEGISVKGFKNISAPKPLAWTKKLNWNMNSDSGKLENTVNIQEAYYDMLDEDYD